MINEQGFINITKSESLVDAAMYIASLASDALEEYLDTGDMKSYWEYTRLNDTYQRYIVEMERRVARGKDWQKGGQM